MEDISVAALRQEVSENSNTIYQTVVPVAKECRAKQAAAAKQLARRTMWARYSAGLAAGTQDRSSRTGGGRQGNQGPAEVTSQGPNPHVADKLPVEIICLRWGVDVREGVLDEGSRRHRPAGWNYGTEYGA